MTNTNALELKLKIAKTQKKFRDYSLNLGWDASITLSYAIELILLTSKKMSLYNSNKEPTADKNVFIEMDYLKENSKLESIINERLETGAVEILRYAVAQKFLKTDLIKNENDLLSTILEFRKAIKEADLDFLKDFVREKSLNYVKEYKLKSEALGKDRNPFSNWGATYRYMLPFIYDTELKNDIWNAIIVLRNNLLHDLELNDWESENLRGWHNHVRSFYGFEGASNYGTQRAVLMLHPKEIPDHKNSYQLVCYFKGNTVSFGLDSGVNISQPAIEPWEKIAEYNYDNILGNAYILYSEILSELKKNKDEAIKLNKDLIKNQLDIKKKEIVERNAIYGDEDTTNLFDDNTSDNTGDSGINNNGNNGNNFNNNGGKNNNNDNNNNDNDDNNNDNPQNKSTHTSQAQSTEKTEEQEVNIELEADIEDEEDCLERGKIADYLTEIIKTRPNSLNIAVYGNWGSGKTKIFNLIKKNLKNDIEIESIDFDALQYNNQENIWTSLFLEIFKKAKSHFLFYPEYLLAYKFMPFLRNFFFEHIFKIAVILLFLQIVAFLANQFNLINFLNDEIKNNLQWLLLLFATIIALIPDCFNIKFLNIDKMFSKCFDTANYKTQPEIESEIKGLIDFAVNFLICRYKKFDFKMKKFEYGYNKRLVIYIDNLDRCSSSNIKQILDSICRFLQTCQNSCKRNLFVLFAIDKSIILKALEKEGIPKEKLDEYLEKIINFNVTLRNEDKIENFTEKLFGKDDETRGLIHKLYSEKKFSPRKLSNLRYPVNIAKKIEKRAITEDEIKEIIYS